MRRKLRLGLAGDAARNSGAAAFGGGQLRFHRDFQSLRRIRLKPTVYRKWIIRKYHWILIVRCIGNEPTHSHETQSVRFPRTTSSPFQVEDAAKNSTQAHQLTVCREWFGDVDRSCCWSDIYKTCFVGFFNRFCLLSSSDSASTVASAARALASSRTAPPRLSWAFPSRT